VKKIPRAPGSRFNNGNTNVTSTNIEEGDERGSSEEEISPNSTLNGVSPANNTPAPTPSHQQKMDYVDFAKAIEIDDVFLQVIFRKPRSKIISVVRRASFNKEASTTEDDRNRTASSAVIENEFKEAFKNLKTDNKSVFQKGMGTLSAAFGLAAKFTKDAAALFDTGVSDEPEDEEHNRHGDSDDEYS